MNYLFEPQAVVGLPIAGRTECFPVRRVYCVGRNYAAHAREMGFDPDREPPFFFCKANDEQSVIPVAANETVSVPYPSLTNNYHYEIELVVAIGKGGMNISIKQASEHILGYAVGLDMTRRDLQNDMKKQGRPWCIGKAFDHSAPMGPIVRAEKLPQIESAAIAVSVNGQVRQSSHVSKLIWNIAETIEHLSAAWELQPGDLIFSGTPEGVAAVVSGDTMVGNVTGLPTLTVQVN